MPPPRAADLVQAESDLLRPTLLRLAAWGVKQIHLVVTDEADLDELMQTARQSTELGMATSIRGRASDLAAEGLIGKLAAAGTREVEIQVLSAVAEVHDSLAGAGDARNVLKLHDTLAGRKLPAVAQLVVTPSTWKTVERTLQMLDDRGVRAVRVWPIVCRDDEPSSWALSAGELVKAATWIETAAPREIKFSWYPALKFDPARSLAQQVRRGPRAAADAVRIEADGSIIPPVGPAIAGGNISQNDWKPIARSEVFRAWKRHQDKPAQCESCPGLSACSGGCLLDEENWVIA
jgi:radical SAM protein with 4Fe4S-binding SPASM domain